MNTKKGARKIGVRGREGYIDEEDERERGCIRSEMGGREEGREKKKRNFAFPF